MSIEDRLRAAITHRTSSIEPRSDGLHHIEEKLMDAQGAANRNRLLLGLAAAVAVVALVVGVLALTDDGDSDVDTVSPTTTTSVEPTTTTEATTSTFAPTVDASQALWPRADTSQRFDDPVSAARSFVVDFVGMVDPVIGEFLQGDARSGEVAVRPVADGPVTTVFVRQLQDDTWFVLGSAVDDIRVDLPEAGATVTCPVHLTGEALAFEGVVQVSVRADASTEPIGTGFVQGGGGPAAPFDGTVDCDTSQLGDGPRYGALVLSTEGGEDSRIWQAGVIRVAFE